MPTSPPPYPVLFTAAVPGPLHVVVPGPLHRRRTQSTRVGRRVLGGCWLAIHRATVHLQQKVIDLCCQLASCKRSCEAEACVAAGAVALAKERRLANWVSIANL